MILFSYRYTMGSSVQEKAFILLMNLDEEPPYFLPNITRRVRARVLESHAKAGKLSISFGDSTLARLDVLIVLRATIRFYKFSRVQSASYDSFSLSLAGGPLLGLFTAQ